VRTLVDKLQNSASLVVYKNEMDKIMNEDIISDLNDELEGVIEHGRSILDDTEIQEKIEELKTEAELLIRKHPIKSVMIGAAAGFILAKIFKSS
jgi:ElaB/YqjD/DUF883 family membrane-anchored ribosome-binding protein